MECGWWGIIPVWGFGTVVESTTDEVPVGERFYGYYPMASHAVLTPTRVSAAGFSDGSSHRQSLHAVYNQYSNTATDPLYTPGSEDIQVLLRPLFFTSWLIDDFLADNYFFGAKVAPEKALILLSSASSKTALGTAFALEQRDDLEVVGLTSPGNVEFCEHLGLYTSVVPYGQITEIDPNRPCVYVDFSGSALIRQTVHEHFSNLLFSSAIGGTHIDNLGGAGHLPGPKPTLFFAPSQFKKRSQEWGAQVLGQRLGAAWFAFTNHVASAHPPWIQVSHQHGPEPLLAAYLELLSGKAQPQTGFVMELD